MNILLFDYDGTILDSLSIAWRAFNESAAYYDIPLLSSPKEFTALYYNNFYEALKAYGIPIDKRIPFVERMRGIYGKNDSEAKVFTGVPEVLDKLKHKADLYVITSNITDTIKSSLKRKKIACFKDILGGDKEKSKVIKMMNLKDKYPNANFFYIGDTVSDVKEAKQAGVKSVAVTWGYHSRQQLEQAKPDLIVDKPEELLKLI